MNKRSFPPYFRRSSTERTCPLNEHQCSAVPPYCTTRQKHPPPCSPPRVRHKMATLCHSLPFLFPSRLLPPGSMIPASCIPRRRALLNLPMRSPAPRLLVKKGGLPSKEIVRTRAVPYCQICRPSFGHGYRRSSATPARIGGNRSKP